MWLHKTRYFFTLLAKNAQFKWSTWRQGKAIAKAYGKPKRLQASVPGRRVVGIGLCSLVALGALYITAPYAVKGYDAAARGFVKVKQVLALRKSALIGAAAKLAPVRDKKEGQVAPAEAPRAPKAAAAVVESKAAMPLADSLHRYQISVAAPAESRPMDFCIVANKADRTLYLLTRSENGDAWKNIETFSILVGGNEGQKMTEGDKRTPEGTYFIVGRKESEELNAIYGPLAYVLNYPNEDDRKAGRTGQGIWIHGTREDTTREATRGCVVLDNKNILTLSRYLQLGIGTPVLIVNTPDLKEPRLLPNTAQLLSLHRRIVEEYAVRQNEFKEIVGQWKQAWESRNIDTYGRFYDAERFSGDGMRWDAWRDKKEKIFKALSKINVGVDKICVSEFSESTSVVLFMQRYETEALHLQRPKKLSFAKSDGQWKIIKEETFSRQELLL